MEGRYLRGGMRRVEVMGIRVGHGASRPTVVLREADAPFRVLPIDIGAPEAASIAMSLVGQRPPRPLAHDLIATLLSRLDATMVAAEVVDLSDGTFFAEVAFDGPHGYDRIDSRASDAIAVALRVGAPVYVDDRVLQIAAVAPESPTHVVGDGRDDTVRGPLEEADIERFAAFLERLGVGDLADGLGVDGTPDKGAPDKGASDADAPDTGDSDRS